MNLRDNIKKVTSLGYTENSAKFYRLNGLSQAARDKMMNERRVRKPRNINILEDDTNKDDNVDVISDKVKPSFDKHGISAAIKQVSGGINFSNEHWEHSYYKQIQSLSEKPQEKISQKFNNTNHHNIQLNKSKAKDTCIKQNNRFHRNAAIMSLIKMEKISWQDIDNPNENKMTKEETEILHGTISNKYLTNNTNQVEFVPLDEDPEICVHPHLQMGRHTKHSKGLSDFYLGIKG
ncbi:uncharacterized protein [Cardiocondyla obscurior]